MGGPSTFVSEADLHGLVDGFIDDDRRSNALRHIESCAADRARVGAWQGQNDLLRQAFAGIEHEPLPITLDLLAKPKVLVLPANDVGTPKPSSPLGPVVRWISGLLFVTAAVAGAWMAFVAIDRDDPLPDTKLRGVVDTALATRSTTALAPDTAPQTDDVSPPSDPLPIAQIPDLAALGFGFTGAEVEYSNPVSILFRYANRHNERLAISVARAPAQEGSPTAPSRIGTTYNWHQDGKAFAIAGTLRPGRLRAIAIALQNDTTRD